MQVPTNFLKTRRLLARIYSQTQSGLGETFPLGDSSIGLHLTFALSDIFEMFSSEEHMKRLYVLATVILTGTLAACNLAASPATPTSTSSPAPTLAFVPPTPIAPQSTVVVIPPTPLLTEQAILDLAAQVMVALKDKDMLKLSGLADPKSGLRFSPYAAVQEKDQVFPVDKLAGVFNDSTVYNWGSFQATGEPLDLTFTDYYARFIYDVDFASAPQVSLNHRLGISTTMDNAAEFYPGAMIVEFYFPGFDPALEGMDWRSLRLVFMQENNTWYLVGIIHDQWTT